MKKLLGILAINLILCNTSIAASFGFGELKMEDWAVNYFIEYIRGKHARAPGNFVIAEDSSQAIYSYCSAGPGNCRSGDLLRRIIKICEKEATRGAKCYQFARGRTVKWDNGINKGKKESRIDSKWSKAEVVAKLTELGFLGGTTGTTTKVEKKKEEKKVEKKKEEKEVEKKVTSKTISGERVIALSWDGYADLIAGTIHFDETDNKGEINLKLPNNDGSCEGSYSLQEGGKGTWQIACTNDMGAGGTLKWDDSGTTGIGRDYKDKKVKFTIAAKS